VAALKQQSMEIIRCPACGCSVQVADALLGRRVRCFGCSRHFVATTDQPSPPYSRREASPSRRPDGGPRAAEEDELANEERRPFCPGCGRRITWGDACCPHCGEELEPEDYAQRWRRSADLLRRDYEPHRGHLIVSLGNISMIVGGLSLCMFGFGALISIPLGALAWVMANRDLERMRDGRMDPRGQSQTETGRTGGIAGIVLGLIFAAFFALIWLAK
jgi:hypothetical protein